MNTWSQQPSCYTGVAIAQPGGAHAHAVRCRTSYDDGHAHGLGSVTTSPGADRRKATAALKQMRRGLRDWLRAREALDRYISGNRPAPLLGRRARPLPPRIAKIGLRQARFNSEQSLANDLAALLVDSGVASATIPASDVSRDPDAAVKLAKIVIAGKAPSEVPAAQAQGLVWFVLAIPAAAVTVMYSVYVKTKADSAAEAERLRCIQAGACTDYGFWLKVAAVGVIGWFAWDKVGIGEVVQGRVKRLR